MPEIWKEVPGHEGCYEVSNLGRVKSLARFSVYISTSRSGNKHIRKLHVKKCILKPGISSNGYPTVALRSISHTVHTLVLKAFIGPVPEGHQVRHLNGDRKDARLCNLIYGTPLENSQDMVLHKTRTRGSQYSSAKITEKSAVEIRVLKGIFSQSELAKLYKVSPAAIQAVHDGRTWKHV